MAAAGTGRTRGSRRPPIHGTVSPPRRATRPTATRSNRPPPALRPVEQLEFVWPRDHRACSRVGDRVLHLVWSQHAAQRVHDGARLEDPVIRDDPFPAVRTEEAHPITGLHTARDQAVCHPVRKRIEFAKLKRWLSIRSATRSPCLSADCGRISAMVVAMCAPGGSVYPYRSASVGSSLAARRAGT